MKFTLLRPALALGVALTLAACGGGGKATFPINVQVAGVQYPGLVLSTNGMDHPVDPPAKAGDVVSFTFPTEIEYGQRYDVLPKGADDTTVKTGAGSQPLHQTCKPAVFPQYGTAGQLTTIDIRYSCSINQYPISGNIQGLTGDGLVLINGSSGGFFPAKPDLDTTTNLPFDVPFVMVAADLTTPVTVPYDKTYGVTVLNQPAGQTCTVTGGDPTLNNGSGTITADIEKAGGVTNIVVKCVNNP